MATEPKAAGAGGDAHVARRDGRRGLWLGGSCRSGKWARRSMIRLDPLCSDKGDLERDIHYVRLAIADADILRENDSYFEAQLSGGPMYITKMLMQ